MSLVSIIIPTYNRAHLITETLNSILNQTYSNWECIIVDDGSTDETFSVVKKYIDKDKRFSIYIRPLQMKKGPSACRNYGINKVKGDFIIFLDSDDLLDLRCLEKRVEFAKKNIELDFWVFKMKTFGFENAPTFIYGEGSNEKIGFYKNDFSKGNHPFVITCPLWKSKIIKEVGGFNEDLFMFEDPELHLRVLKAGYRFKFANFDDSDCYYRLKENNVTDLSKKLSNYYIFFECHLEKNDPYSIIYYKKVLNSIILDNKILNSYLRFFKLGSRKRILNYKNFIYGLFIILYYFFNINKKKNLGYNYLKKQFNDF